MSLDLTSTSGRTILAFKAGRAFRRAGTNFVDASPTKGAIVLTNEDGLIHFMWKDRTTGELGEDLILFPGDAKLEKVPQSSWGRTYVLKFESSDQKHFFWLQDSSTRRDEEFVTNLNRTLADPNIVAIWDARNIHPASEASTSAAGSSTSQPDTTPAGTTPEQLEQLRGIVSSMTGFASEDELWLTDVLSSQNLLPLFQSHSELLPALFPHLPPELIPSSDATPQQAVEILQRTTNSPPFRSAVAQLDRALRTGALGEFVRSLGLPASAATGVGAFLAAIAEQAGQEGRTEERMEED
ncbi:adhesion regulating molecule [Suillus clintonianus]|uniref:adhesion regulating molecule n=1 Tax=Suillus clintonianus TaxID=1904413 RepID=UPI001B862049|nr:adhesion regulating molecule [Suillus clintonianus]KAG2126526.1 adhesion regulating molecule [Suillus clintonianus]